MDNKYCLLVICFYLTTESQVNAVKMFADFSKVVTSSCFVDKTLFLKEFLNGDRKDSNTKMITAPKGFGKSTILDMIRKFLSNEYNATGKEVDYKNNPNYNIFCSPMRELNICKNNTDFIEKHFGQYPVLSMNFSPLKFVKNLRTFIEGLREVQAHTYEQHQYLLNDEIEWPRSILKAEGFTKRMDPYVPLTENEVVKGFSTLTGFLHKYFNKKVIILFDNYDSHWKSLLFRKIETVDHILLTLKRINEQLFKYEGHMEKGILTGILKVQDIGIPISSKSLMFYNFQGDHVFSKYYGFTDQDIKQIIKNIDVHPKNGLKVSNSLKRYYNGYSVQGHEDLSLYNALSIKRFIKNGMKLQNYWIRTKFLDNVFNFCKINDVSGAMERLLRFGCIKACTNMTFTEIEMKKINDINSYMRVTYGHPLELIIRVFFDFGFLTTERENESCLKLPNNETQMAIGSLLTLNYINTYKLKSDEVESFQKCINEFVPGIKQRNIFNKFQLALHNLFHKSKHLPRSKNDVDSILLVILSEKYPIGEQSTLKYPNCFEGIKEFSELIIFNDYKMALILKVKFQEKNTKYRFKTEELATQGHNDILTKYNSYNKNIPTQLQNDDVIGATYIGIGFEEEDKKITIVGSMILFENRTKNDYRFTYTY